MKMRLTPAVTARSAWLIAGRSAAGAAVLVVSVSACTAGGSSVPSIFTPTPTGGATVSSTHTPSPSDPSSSTKQASATATARTSAPASATARRTATATATATPTRAISTPPTTAPTPTHTAVATHTAIATHTAAAPAATATTLYPTAAPQTGGGGTAGLQDSLIFVVGGGAVLVGFGSLAYRRRLARKYGTGRRRLDREPLDRESADR